MKVKVTIRQGVVSLAEVACTYFANFAGNVWANNLIKFWLWLGLLMSCIAFAGVVIIVTKAEGNEEKITQEKRKIRANTSYIPNWATVLLDALCIGMFVANGRYGLSVVWMAQLILQQAMRAWVMSKSAVEVEQEKKEEVFTVTKVMKRTLRF